jgi:putative NADH-flavin reductase
MKIVILGAAGRTGQPLIQQALLLGHEVTAFARDRSKIALQHDRLTIVEGDVREPDRVSAAIEQQAAVISVLGQTRPVAPNLLTIGVSNILKAMQQHQVRRFVYQTGAGVRSPHDGASPLAAKVMMFLVKKISPEVLRDSEEAARLITASDRDWIIARVPRLSDDPAKGQAHGGFDRPGFAAISRSDAAEFLLTQLIDPTYLREMPFVSYR